MSCFGKGYIDKMVLAGVQHALEESRYDTLKGLLEQQYLTFAKQMSTHMSQLRMLRKTDRIVISFLNHMEATHLKAAISKKIHLQYFEENGARLTHEFFLSSLANIQRFNIYKFKEPHLAEKLHAFQSNNNTKVKLHKGKDHVSSHRTLNAQIIFAQETQSLFEKP